MSYTDPPEPPEGGSLMRAKDLVNRVCLFRPTGMGEWPAKPATENEKEKGPQPYVECDVWVLDRSGILEEATGVRVGWWKAVEQLKEQMGQFVGAKPEQEEGSNAIYLRRLEGAAREVAMKVTAEIENAAPLDDDEQPF